MSALLRAVLVNRQTATEIEKLRKIRNQAVHQGGHGSLTWQIVDFLRGVNSQLEGKIQIINLDKIALPRRRAPQVRFHEWSSRV